LLSLFIPRFLLSVPLFAFGNELLIDGNLLR
jgi:hypothetical protein